MSQMRYNTGEVNPIIATAAVLVTPRGHDTRKVLLMQPQYITLHPNAKNIAGQRFGRLLVLGPVGRTTGTRKYVQWLCSCDCGNTHVAISHNLSNGSTQSCGCLARELTSLRSKTHGMLGTRIYKTLSTIIQRCSNPNHKSYAFYGGRGITVCDEWRHNFQAFYDHVTQLPDYGKKSYTLDRIDNDGNYEPGNVRWATPKQQSRNTRRNHLLTYKGKRKCLSEWAEEFKMPYSRLHERLAAGWSVERALTAPPRSRISWLMARGGSGGG